MIIGDRLRALRDGKNLSQGELEQRTGLLRCYISRVEHGYTVPSLETLERMARGLEVPIYQLIYDGDEPAKIPVILRGRVDKDRDDWASWGKGSRLFTSIRQLVSHMTERERSLLLHVARKLSARKREAS